MRCSLDCHLSHSTEGALKCGVLSTATYHTRLKGHSNAVFSRLPLITLDLKGTQMRCSLDCQLSHSTERALKCGGSLDCHLSHSTEGALKCGVLSTATYHT